MIKGIRISKLMQIGVFSLLVMVPLAVIISSIIVTHLNQCLALLTEFDTAMINGIPIADHEAYSITSIRTELSKLRWITYLTVGSALAVSCCGFFTIIWLGVQTISRHTQERELRVRELRALNNMIQRQIGLKGNQSQPPQPLPARHG